MQSKELTRVSGIALQLTRSHPHFSKFHHLFDFTFNPAVYLFRLYFLDQGKLFLPLNERENLLSHYSNNHRILPPSFVPIRKPMRSANDEISNNVTICLQLLQKALPKILLIWII